MSPMSHPVTGARYVPQPGNAGQRGSWTIRDLPAGTYYWAVQSVDHAFNGSKFSEEASFTVAPENRLPQIFMGSATNSRHVLTLDAPVRSLGQLLHSFDLLTWETNVGYIYIGSEPVTFSNGESDTRFYRFQLVE